MRTLAKIKRKASKQQRGREPLIVFATLKEAAASIELLGATPLIRDELYSFSQGHILISGVGSISSAIKVTTYSYIANEIWNIGVAGSFIGHEIGSIHPIQNISKWIPAPIDSHSHLFANSVHPQFITKNEGLRLLSTDVPLHNSELTNSLKTSFDLIDMEGYGIAFAANMSGRPLSLWKCVSDFASTNGHSLIQDHLNHCSIKMAEHLNLLLGRS